MSTLCTDLSHIGHLARREYALGDTKLAMLTDDGALALAPSARQPAGVGTTAADGEFK